MRFPPESVRISIRSRSMAAWYRGVVLRRERDERLRPFIVTGPPRSGTSLLSAVLSRKPNVIVLNEPKQLEGARLTAADPATLLRGCIVSAGHRAVRTGTVINKADPSNPNAPTTDTFNKGSVRCPVPVSLATDKPFAIGAKITMPFIDAMDELCDGWSDLRVIAIIREPLATINSWRNSFGWQKGLDDPKAAPRFRLHDLVPEDDDPLKRRAYLWKLTVESLFDQARRRPGVVHLMRYENFLGNPAEMTSEAVAHVGCPMPETPIDLSDVRKQTRPKYAKLSDDDVAMISEICGNVLPPLGTRLMPWLQGQSSVESRPVPETTTSSSSSAG